MVKITTLLRRIFFVLLICLACLVPIPIIFGRKENANQVRIEQLDEDQEEEDALKELF